MKFSTLHLHLLSLLLLLHSLVTLSYANPMLMKPAGYTLDCVSEGGENQTYCFHNPHNYLCTDQGEVDSVTKSEFCESGCKCSKRDGEKVPRLTEAEDVVGTGDFTPESPDFGDMTASTSMDLIPVNPSITKRHDYALVCIAPGTPNTWYSRLCSGSPYKYYCAKDGKVHRQSVYTVCDVYCECQKMGGQQCFVDRLGLTPICSETDPSSNGTDSTSSNEADSTSSNETDSTDLVPVSAVNEVSAESTEITETPGSISKRHDYALVCDPPGTAPKYYSSYCSNSPYKYYCTSSGKLAYQNEFSVCDIYCKCKTVPGKNCFVDRLGLAPICSDTDPSDNGTNSTDLDSTNSTDLDSTNSTDLDSTNSTDLDTTNSTDLDMSDSTDLDMSDSTDLVPVRVVEQIPAESTEVDETSGSLSKRHDYALVCNTGFGGTTYSRVCAGSPYKYYCSANGKVYKQIADKLCDEACQCQHMNKQCLQAKIILPVCSEVNSTDNSTTVSTSPTANVTDDRTPESTDIPSSAVASVPDDDDTIESTTTKIAADTSVDLAPPASPHKRLPHNYALDCDHLDSYATGTLYTKYCVSTPRNYFCDSAGKVRYLNDDILCDYYCLCQYLTPNCYVFNAMAVCGMKTGQVTHMQTGAVVGYLDSNGTTVLFENSTLTG